MFKKILGFILIILGIIGVGNFINHHITVPFNDDSSHALIGLILIFAGIWLMRVKAILNGWTNLSDKP